MFQYLENLRRKPEGERRKAVLLISLCVTLVIAIIWGVGLSLRMGDTDFSFDDASARPAKETPSLRDTFSNFIDQASRIIGGETTE